MPYRDDDYQPLDPREYPDDALDDEDASLPCPNCFAVIHDEAQRCPRCGHWLTREEFRRKPLWVVVAAVVCLGVTLFLVYRGF